MKRVRVVLYRSIYPRNIGMCARAMANMGLENLILVAPRTELTVEAKQGAAHAQEVLANARVYSSHDEFMKNEGNGLRIALSGRDNRLKEPDRFDHVLKSFRSEPDHMIHNPNENLYLIFGPEDDGLSSEEMELCHFICRLPTYGEITSLNLSHAVLLTSYIVRDFFESNEQKAVAAPEAEPVFFPGDAINKWLEALGFDLSSPKVNIEKVLNRILLSRSPTREELRILETVVQQTVRKLLDRKK